MLARSRLAVSCVHQPLSSMTQIRVTPNTRESTFKLLHRLASTRLFHSIIKNRLGSCNTQSGATISPNYYRSFHSTILTASPSTSTLERQKMPNLAQLDPSKLVLKETENAKPKLPAEQLVFGKTFSDHMLKVPWNDQEGWKTPEIVPYGDLCLDPATIVFHYAFECFEGLKAYRDEDDNIRLFRAEDNMARMNRSATRIALPGFDPEKMVQLLAKFLEVEKAWVPKGRGYALYIRPTLIGTQACLGVHVPTEALLYVIASPVGPYYPTGFKAVSLEATDYAVRAWPGGVGDKKLGANYAPCVLPAIKAAERGHQQNLWLFGPEGNVTEVGTMNFFCVFKKPNGKKELVTAPLDGTILEGITRDSILDLARARLDPNEWEVNERYYTIKEVADAAQAGNLVEAFGAGTAAVVSPVKRISWHDKDITVPLQQGKQSGPFTETVAQWIGDIQYGITPYKNWSKVVA